MAAVDISIGHNDYLMVAELFDIELIPDAGAERDYHWIELVVAVDFIGARFLDIQLLPHMARIAWKRLSLPWIAEPAAESPSTMYISQRDGSRSLQS